MPLGEESESYLLDILSGSTLRRRVSVSAPQFQQAISRAFDTWQNEPVIDVNVAAK